MSLWPTYLVMRRNRDRRTCRSLVAWGRARRCDSTMCLGPSGCWLVQQSHRSPPAPGRWSAAFLHHCLHLHHLLLCLCRPQHLCHRAERSLRPFQSLETEGPSKGRSRPVEGETTARTWTAAKGKGEYYLDKEKASKTWNIIKPKIFYSSPLVRYIYWPQRDRGGSHTALKRC